VCSSDLPNQEAVFYASGSSIYETNWLSGAAKKQAVTSAPSDLKKAIPFQKSVDGRKHPVIQ
jgi:hypothetical protein